MSVILGYNWYTLVPPFLKKEWKNSNFNIFSNNIVQNGAVPEEWHLKLSERVHLLTGLCQHLEGYADSISQKNV